MNNMIVLANLMYGVAYILKSLIWLIQILIIARVIVSWVGADPYNRLVQIIVSSTEPLLAPIRKKLPLVGGGIDLSPLVLLFGVILLQYVLVVSLQEYAAFIKQSAYTTIPTRAY